MKTKSMQTTVVLVIVGMLLAGAGTFFLLKGGEVSTIMGEPETEGAWANKLVNYKLIVTDRFTGDDVDASLKLFDEQPADWGNPRGTFTDSSKYTIYTATDGNIIVDKEYPNTYYGVLTATGYNTEFVTFTIPSGEGRGDIADYQSNPDSIASEMALIGATTDEDFAFTLVNGTAKLLKNTVLLTVDENTEFRGWKVIVNDEEGFSMDTDGDGVYDEGISKFMISIGGKEATVFQPNKGIDAFDSNDEFTVLLDGVKIADEDDLVIKVEIEANTGDFVGANDEVWGEGEGVLSYIKIYDAESNLFATVDVTA